MNRSLIFIAFIGLFLSLNAPSGLAVEAQSIRFLDRLLNITQPEAPFVFEDAVVFTATSATASRIGIAFAHEGYTKVHWFQRLVRPDQATASAADKNLVNSKTSPAAILIYIYEFPIDLNELVYRLVIDGQWTADPWNPERRIDSSGLAVSRLGLPPADPVKRPANDQAGGLHFILRTGSGQAIYVAGSFNAWDPFMYEMLETSPNLYELKLPLPPGIYQYAYFIAGHQIADPANPQRVYAVDGRIASEIVVR